MFLQLEKLLGSTSSLQRTLWDRTWPCLGASWAQLGASWAPLGLNLEPHGRLLGSTWSLLRTSWAQLGRSWGASGCLLGLLGLQVSPNGLQVVSKWPPNGLQVLSKSLPALSKAFERFIQACCSASGCVKLMCRAKRCDADSSCNTDAVFCASGFGLVRRNSWSIDR